MQFKRTTITLLGLVLALVLVAAPVMAASVEPVFVSGNPSCTDLGYAYGEKWNYPGDSTGGTYPLGNGTVTWSTDGTYVTWSSTIGVDAVIMKGGPNANVYKYDPPAESFGDSGLVSPNTPGGSSPAGLSHVEFCFDYEVVVTKTVNTSFDRRYEWTIDKSVAPASHDLFMGESGTSTYTVAVTKSDPIDYNFAVSGSISVFNPAPVAATIESVTDFLDGYGNVPVSCGVTFPYALAAGATLPCTYGVAPQATNVFGANNTATATTSGAVGGDTDVKPVVFGNPANTYLDSINVDDTNGDSWQFNDSDSVNYDRTFTCGDDEGKHDNVATIVETGDWDDASVEVNCYELDVDKTVETSYNRDYDWDISKTATPTSLTLKEGQVSPAVQFDVDVWVTGYTDMDHTVSGTITIYNPAPMAATLDSVTDVVSGGYVMAVECDSLTVPAAVGGVPGELTCTYSGSLPDGDERTNTATATQSLMGGGTAEYNSEAETVAFGAPDYEYDTCITVNDDKYGSLGEACVSDAPVTFGYTQTFGTSGADVTVECGENEYINTATFETSDQNGEDDDTGSASATVDVTVECLTGCTLTQGYWKTHSAEGPAPYDEDWKNLGELEEDTPFFLSGQTWYQVFWTAPAGNVYYNLAHQYMAAKLNILAGASSTDDVDAAIAAAEALFAAHNPTYVATLRGKNGNDLRAQFTNLASTLDQYNNGLIGPGHCSE